MTATQDAADGARREGSTDADEPSVESAPAADEQVADDALDEAADRIEHAADVVRDEADARHDQAAAHRSGSGDGDGDGEAQR